MSDAGTSYQGADMNRLESLEGRTLLSAAGDLDATFGPDQTGKVVQPLFGGSYDYAGAIAVQRDGKVLVAGSGANVTVVRYNPDGSLDQTFGAEHDGRAVAPIEGGGFTTSAVRVMRDGRIIVGQTYGSGFVLVRFNPDGLPDRSFGGGSGFVREASTNDYVTNLNDLVIRPDGRILTGGLRIDDGGAGAGFYFVQFNVDGSHDASFGPSGDGRLKLTGRGLDEIDCLRLLKDGRVLAAGRSRRDFALARITADGKADEAFGQGGFVYTDFGSRIEVARGIAVLDDKRIVLAGESGGDVVLARYFRNGLLDHTFGTGGKVRYDLGSPVDRANDLQWRARRCRRAILGPRGDRSIVCR